MEDSDHEIAALKEMTMKALEQCNDPDIMDLIYKLLTFDNIIRRSRWLRLFYPLHREQFDLTSI